MSAILNFVSLLTGTDIDKEFSVPVTGPIDIDALGEITTSPSL